MTKILLKRFFKMIAISYLAAVAYIAFSAFRFSSSVPDFSGAPVDTAISIVLGSMIWAATGLPIIIFVSMAMTLTDFKYLEAKNESKLK